MSSMERVSEPREGALAEKAYAAERGLALLRLLVVLSGWLSYPLLDKAGTIPWLAYLLLGLAGLYALSVYVLEPSRKRAMPSATVTSVSDSVLTMLWLYATGGIHSPYVIAVPLAVCSVGLRFTSRETLLSALFFAGSYLGMVLVTSQLAAWPALALIHLCYIFLAGQQGQLMASMVLDQLVAKQELQKRLRMEEHLSLSEAALAEAQAIAHVGSWSWEFSSGQHTWSAELYRIMGREPGQPAGHGAFLECIHPEERPALELALAQAQADGRPFHGEYRLLRPSGEVRQVHLKGKVVPDASGQPARMSGTAQDITERRAMERRLVIADRMAALGTLAGGVAHEINNPLTFITTNLAYIKERLDQLTPRQLPQLNELRGAVSDAREGAQRVQNIVKELKAFSRVDEARLVPVDVHRGLEFSINLASREFRARARLVKEFGQVPPVLGDETRLGQVFLNLLVNAAHAIPEGNVEAHTITVRTGVDASGNVAVEIRDTGAGIPPELLERIFEPFFTTKPTGIGTGLGLSICQGIVTSLGGKISVQSAVGRGTAFTVTLPATEEPQAPAPEPAPAPVRVEQARLRLLIIDDEPMVAAALSRTLRGEYDVTTSVGLEALRRLLDGEDFDAIICDLAMPDITGMELYERLREQRPALAARMIFLTGGAVTPKAQDFIAQARHWTAKPVELPALRALVREVVGQGLLSGEEGPPGR